MNKITTNIYKINFELITKLKKFAVLHGHKQMKDIYQNDMYQSFYELII